MNIPLFIAWRYFFSKKKLKVINIISLISLIGISITTASLLIVLSVFNGFTSVGTKILATSSPPILIEANKGKVFSLDSVPYNKIKELKNISSMACVLKENALISFADRQSVVELKGVNMGYLKINRLDTAILYGDFLLNKFGKDACVLGAGIASEIDIPKNAEVMGAMIDFSVPKRQGKISIAIEESFNSRKLIYAGCFQMNAPMDNKDVFIPLSVLREMLEYGNNEVSGIFVNPKSEKYIPELKIKIKKILGKDYVVKDIFEQEPLYDKIVRAERLGVYIILSFIIFIATFNVMGALSLLIMDKKKDIQILFSMGLTQRKVRRVYFINGLILSFAGALIGLFIGIIICLLQQELGIVKMGTGEFIVDAFPIKIKAIDILSILILVLSIGAISVSIMVSRIRLINKKN